MNPIHRGIAVDIWDEKCNVVGRRYFNFGPKVWGGEGAMGVVKTVVNIPLSVIAGRGNVDYGSAEQDDIKETVKSNCKEDRDLLSQLEQSVELNSPSQCYSLMGMNCRHVVNEHIYDGMPQDPEPGANNPYYDPGTGIYGGGPF